MLRVTHEDTEYVLARCSDKWIELVHAETGELKKILSPNPILVRELLEKATLNERPLDQRFPLWPDRGEDFLPSLHARRVEQLQDAVKDKRKLHKGPADGTKKPRGKRKQSEAEMLQQLIALSLGGK